MGRRFTAATQSQTPAVVKCKPEQDTLPSSLYWLNQENVPTRLKNCDWNVIDQVKETKERILGLNTKMYDEFNKTHEAFNETYIVFSEKNEVLTETQDPLNEGDDVLTETPDELNLT